MGRRSYRRVNGNLRTVAKSNEMIRRETPNRIAKPSVHTLKFLVIILARKVKDKNMVRQLNQRCGNLCHPAGHYSKGEPPMSLEVY